MGRTKDTMYWDIEFIAARRRTTRFQAIMDLPGIEEILREPIRKAKMAALASVVAEYEAGDGEEGTAEG
jgi:hypothetical protein